MATPDVATPPSTARSGNFFADVMHPERRGSSHRIEFLAGLTTFVTMAYIIFVNTSIMQAAGLNPTALIIGTIFAAVVPTLVMGLWADLPWALAPGLGYNALFAYTVVSARHFPVGAALALVFLDGVAFTLIAIGPWREKIIMGIPLPIKLAAGAGIGLFIAFIGLANAGIVKFDVFADVKSGQTIAISGNTGLPVLSVLSDPVVLVALAGLVITGLLLAWKVRGGLLIGILATAAIAWGTAIIVPSTRAALLPFNPTNPKGISDFIALPDMGTFFSKGVGQIDFAALFSGNIVAGAILLFFLTFLVTDMMDSFGTFSGLAAKLGILDEKGNFPGSGKALIVDAAAGMWGPLTGNATIATFIESAAGVGEGGKTGLTAVWTALLFLVALFFVPLVGLVPAVATAPALIIVGFMMIEPIVKIGFHEITDGLPAFLALLTMPLTYSIADGMFIGITSYVALKVLTGRIREVSWVMWAFAILLVIAKVLDASNL
ncbi:MAG TPA: NCS2 family permease [Ktedonobacterales bacterium]|nr:NCS2 family permease [Ktedonobacterales bacterium]